MNSETPRSEILKPCPFCGGQAEVEIKGNAHTPKRSVIIKCKTCRVQRTNSGIISPIATLLKNSTEQWNARQLDLELAAEEKELAELREGEKLSPSLRRDHLIKGMRYWINRAKIKMDAGCESHAVIAIEKASESLMLLEQSMKGQNEC